MLACVSQPVGALTGTGRVRGKRTEDRELSSSDALAVYIDGAGSGGGGGQRQIRFGTSPSRLTRSGHTKPQGAGTIPGGAATGAVLNPKEGAAETGDDSANRISTHFLVKREKEKKKKEKRKEKPALTPSLARKYQLGFSMLK